MRKRISVFLLLALLVCCMADAVYANSPGPNLDGSSDPNPIFVIGLVVIYVLIIGFTCLVEWLIAIPFALHRQYAKTIIATNLVTQIVMHLLEILSVSIAPPTSSFVVWYVIVVLLLEILVLMVEFLIYRKRIPEVPARHLLQYTVCANTASLLGGILLLMKIL